MAYQDHWNREQLRALYTGIFERRRNLEDALDAGDDNDAEAAATGSAPPSATAEHGAGGGEDGDGDDGCPPPDPEEPLATTPTPPPALGSLASGAPPLKRPRWDEAQWLLSAELMLSDSEGEGER